MDISKCKQKSDEKPDLSRLPISSYAKKLGTLVKQRYFNKISAIGIDPVLIEGKHFEADCLPPVESTDLLFYLVLETSFYTQKQFKAFRSLEAYNQMVSGFIASVQGHIVANKFAVLAKVRHSQRMSDSLIPIWIITDREGTILSTHCLGWAGRIVFTNSQCALLFRSVDENKCKIVVNASKMLVASPHVRGPRGVCNGPRYKLYFG